MSFFQKLKHIRDRTWQVTEPTPMEIGQPATPPPDEALNEMRVAISNIGATSVYWFWLSLDGDAPHLGLAVAPNDNEVISRIAQALEPVWQKYSPEDSRFDILRLGDPDLDRKIIECGQLLYGEPLN
jgi:hypothetical protein